MPFSWHADGRTYCGHRLPGWRLRAACASAARVLFKQVEEAEATGKVNFHITALPAPYVHFIEQSGGIHSPNAAPASVAPSAPELEVVRFFFEPFGQELGSFLPGGPAVPSAVGRVAVDIHQGGRVQYSSRSILSPYEAFEFFNDVVRPQHSAASATTTARTMACRTRRRSWLTRERGAGGLPRNAKRHRPLAGGGVAMSQTGAAQPRNGGGSMARGRRRRTAGSRCRRGRRSRRWSDESRGFTRYRVGRNGPETRDDHDRTVAIGGTVDPTLSCSTIRSKT